MLSREIFGDAFDDAKALIPGIRLAFSPFKREKALCQGLLGISGAVGCLEILEEKEMVHAKEKEMSTFCPLGWTGLQGFRSSFQNGWLDSLKKLSPPRI